MSEDWRQFVQLNRGAHRRILSVVTASFDTDPVPFGIWAAGLAVTPLLLTAIHSTIRLSMIDAAGGAEVVEFVALFRVFYVLYAMLLALLATAAIWDALHPDRADQEVMAVLPVRPLVLAAARLAGATRVMLLLVAAVAAPVALTFGAATGLQRGGSALLRVVPAHMLTMASAMLSVSFTLVTIRAVVVLIGSERMAERLASLLQVLTLLVFIEAFVFLPGVLQTIVRVLHAGGTPPLWCQPPLWFAALYDWIAEGGARTADVNRALIATCVPPVTAMLLSLAPAAWLGRRAQASLSRDRASLVTCLARVLVTIRRPNSAVAGMVVFVAATLARGRRHALLLATATGMAIAMATIELLTASFQDRFNLSAPRAEILGVPLVAIFFSVLGLRAAMARPADAQASWIFRMASPSVADGRQTARLVAMWLGLVPVLIVTGLVFLWLWGPATALTVLALDAAAASLLMELAFANWNSVPCGSLHAADADSGKSRWLVLMVALYFFAFRGADLQMFALRRGAVVWLLVAVVLGIAGAIRLRERSRPTATLPVTDVSSDGLSKLQLSELDA